MAALSWEGRHPLEGRHSLVPEGIPEPLHTQYVVSDMRILEKAAADAVQEEAAPAATTELGAWASISW